MTPFFTVDFMQLVLYKNLSADNEINKVLVDGTGFNINLKQETDIITPELFLVKLAGINYNDFNYAEIVELKRFYFIDSISIVNASLFKLECSTDVLETYKAEILAGSGVMRRPVKTGDYGEIKLDVSGKFLVSEFSSDIVLEPSDVSILSVLGG